MDNIQDFLNTIAAGQDTKPSDVVVPSSTQNDTSQYLSHGQNTWNYEHRGNNSSSESNQWFPKLLSFDCHSTKNEPRNAVISAFLGSCTLFKLCSHFIYPPYFSTIFYFFLHEIYIFYHLVYMVSKLFRTRLEPQSFSRTRVDIRSRI